MSKGQSPFDTNYSSNTSSLINVGNEDTEDAEESITFIKGSAGNGKRLYVDGGNLTYNPFTQTLSSYNQITDTIELRDYNIFPTNMKIECVNGAVLFTGIPQFFPYDAGAVYIGGLGTILLTGGSSYFAISDRTTGDLFQQFSDAGTFILKSNFSQNVFEITTAGNSALKGTGAGLRFFERLSSPSNYYSLFTSSSGSVFNITYNATTIATITTAGITTLVPQKIQNTLSSSASAHFLTFVPLSATTTAGQVISTNASLNYVPSTGTLTAVAFVGSLTGSATLIDTTLSSSAVAHYLTFVPLSATTPAGQVVSTNASLYYFPSSGVLTASTFSGNFQGSLTGSATLVGTTLATSGTKYFTFVDAPTTYPAGQAINVDANITFDLGTNTLTCPIFAGSLTGSATLIDTTQQTTGTYFLTLAPLTTTQTAGQVLYTGIVSYQYLSGTNGVMINRGSYRMLDRSNATSFFWDIFTTTGNALTFDYNSGTKQITISTAGVLGGLSGISRLTNPLYIGTTDGYTSGASHPIACLNNTIASGIYNNIQLGHSSTNYNSWFLGARYDVGVSTTIFSIAPYGVAQTACWYVDGDGNTHQAQYAYAEGIEINSTFIHKDQTTPANYWILSANLNNYYFNNAWSALAIPLVLNGDGGGVSTYNQRNYAYPCVDYVELDSPMTSHSSGTTTSAVGTSTNDYASFVAITNPTSTTSGALATFTIQAVNPNNRLLELSTSVNFSGILDGTIAGTNRIFVNMTAITITMTRNGGSFTSFAYEKPTLPLAFDYSFVGTTNRAMTQPIFQLNIKFNPLDRASSSSTGLPLNDVYVVKMVATITQSVISGGGVFVGDYGGAGFSFNLGLVHTGTGITFNTADAPVSALALTKSGSTLQPTFCPYYLKADYTNLVYQRTISSEVATYEPACFTSDFIYYDITWVFSTAPTAYTALSFGLANSIGDVLLTGYTGRTCVLGDTYSQVAWTNLAFVAYCLNTTYQVFKMSITYPNATRRKTITGTNNGSANGTTFFNCPHISTGANTTATAYNSMYWSLVGTAVSGTIYITGRNT